MADVAVSVDDLLHGVGLKATIRRARPDAWDEAWSRLSYQPVAYAASMLDYQHAYFRGAGWKFQDISMVLLNDHRPCGIWPLALATDPAGEVHLTSAGGAVMAPLFVPGLSPRGVKRFCRKALDFLLGLALELEVPTVEVEQGVDPFRVGEGVSEWHRQLMAAGAMLSLKHELFVDLGKDFDEIRRGFRKSYKPLINAGLREWHDAIVDQSNIDAFDWEEFRHLHRAVAGRATRSRQTWAMQRAMVAAGEAFLVCLRAPSGRLVGAGFFQYTRDEGIYAVGAYDRSLFDKPLGHVVQHRAIERMKADGRKWYKIGERSYFQDSPRPTEKEVSISSFKEGFASHVFLKCVFRLPVVGGRQDNSDRIRREAFGESHRWEATRGNFGNGVRSMCQPLDDRP